MPVCRCSNCDADGCGRLLLYHRFLTLSDFDEAVTSGIPQSVLIPPPVVLNNRSRRLAPSPVPCADKDILRQHAVCVNLCDALDSGFSSIFGRMYGSSNSDLGLEVLFTKEHAWMICKNHERLANDLSLDSIFGSEPLSGTYSMVSTALQTWLASPMYIDLCEALEDEQIMLDQAYLDEIEIQKEKIQMKIKTQQRLAVEAAGRLERKKTRADNKAKRLIQKQERKDFWAREAAVLAEIKKVHYGLDCDVADRPEQVRYNLQDFIFTICI